MNDVHERKAARLETWLGGPAPCLVVVGWDLVADCGCVINEGMRLDHDEPVIGFSACELHEQQIQTMFDHYRDEVARRAEFEEVGPDDERPLHQVLLERFRDAVS